MDLAPGESTGASSAGGAVVVFDVDENQTGNLKKASFSRSSYSGRDSNESESKHDDCSFSAAANSCGDFVLEGVESTLSPLTCDFDESNIKGDHSVNGNKGNCSPTITLDRSLHQCNSIHQDTDSQSIDSEGNNAVMKAEVRLLLHWINGLYEILSDDRQRPFLKKIIFGICRSRSRLREDEGCKHCNGISDRRSKKCEDDEVIESFSVSSLHSVTNLSHLLNTGYTSCRPDWHVFVDELTFICLTAKPCNLTDLLLDISCSYVRNITAIPRAIVVV